MVNTIKRYMQLVTNEIGEFKFKKIYIYFFTHWIYLHIFCVYISIIVILAILAHTFTLCKLTQVHCYKGFMYCIEKWSAYNKIEYYLRIGPNSKLINFPSAFKFWIIAALWKGCMNGTILIPFCFDLPLVKILLYNCFISE